MRKKNSRGFAFVILFHDQTELISIQCNYYCFFFLNCKQLLRHNYIVSSQECESVPLQVYFNNFGNYEKKLFI